MSEDAVANQDLPADLQELIQQLQAGSALDRQSIYWLAAYLRWYCDQPVSYAPALVPAFANWLKQQDSDTIEESFEDLYDSFGKIFSLLGPSMLLLAEHPHPWVRQVVAKAAREIKSAPDDAVRAVVRLLADPDPETRGQACLALAAVSPTRTSTQLLIQRLNDPEEDVVGMAILGLGAIGSEAAEGVGHLLRFLAPQCEKAKDHITLTLQALTTLPLPPDFYRHLRPLVKRDWVEECRQPRLVPWMRLGYLAQILGRLGPAASDCVPDLERLLLVDDQILPSSRKSQIACALVQVDPDNQPGRAFLLRLATSPDPEKRRDFMDEMLGLPRTVWDSFREWIEKLADDPDEDARMSAGILLEPEEEQGQ